jgi:hypothetical protein
MVSGPETIFDRLNVMTISPIKGDLEASGHC